MLHGARSIATVRCRRQSRFVGPAKCTRCEIYSIDYRFAYRASLRAAFASASRAWIFHRQRSPARRDLMAKPFENWTVLPHGRMTRIEDNILTVTGKLHMPPMG